MAETAVKTAGVEKVRLKGTQRVAAMMLSIDKGVARLIFQKLDDLEVKSITSAMFEIGSLHQDTRANILTDFLRAMATGGNLAASSEDIRVLLSETLDEKRAKEIIASVTSFKDNTLNTLGTYDSKVLANFLMNEHPQTIAVILCHLGTDKSGQVLKLLPEDIRAEIVMRMAYLEEITPEALGDIEEAVKEALKGLGSAKKHKMGGIEFVSDSLNRLDKRTTNLILEKISSDNTELVDAIKANMFVFEDLIKFDDRGIQEILKGIDSQELALALKVASEDLKEKIFTNMSERAAKMLREDLEVMGPVKVSDVEKAQGNILKSVDKLLAEGKIVLAGEGEEAVV